MNNKYQNGKIYTIWDKDYTKCYIGSTIETLSQRMTKHRSSYRRSREGKCKYKFSLSLLFDEFGLENCRIELLELYPCNSREELNAREGQCERENECINKRIEGRTKKEWREDNKEKIKEQRRERYESNKEEEKAYRENNKEHIKEQAKIWRERNKETIKQKQKDWVEQHKEDDIGKTTQNS